MRKPLNCPFMELGLRAVIRTGKRIENDALQKCAAPWENQQSAYAKTTAQISLAVFAKLISAFVFATRIVQFL